MKAKRLVIKNPCSESWAGMTPQDNGRHCAKCDKVVVDLTSTDVRTAFQLVSQSEQKMCVQLLPKHLEYMHSEEHTVIHRDFSLKAIAMSAALITFASLNSCAPERHIRGKVNMVDSSGKSTGFRAATEKKSKTYTLFVRDVFSHEGISAAGVTVFHGGNVDSLRADNTGKCSFEVAEKEFRVEVYVPDHELLSLTQRDFKLGKATAEPDYIILMGEVAPEE